MKVLLLAPQPFYQERGTPIAVDMVLKVLSQRREQVDVATYHEGQDVTYDGVRIHRHLKLPFIKGIRPGISWKKLVCDGLMLFKAMAMSYRERYDLVHAVEESVFIALVLKWVFKVPYIYDMDSSLSQQLVEKWPWFAPLASLLECLERLAVRNAIAVVVVCDALGRSIDKYHPNSVVVLRDISLLKDGPRPLDLRSELGINGPVLMYVGNLEGYQGIDLLLESFAIAAKEDSAANLAIIGGNPSDIEKYQKKSRQLEIHQRVHFLGPRPVNDLAGYLAQADILLSPRIKGQNTPMKLYSYLHSGRALLATNLPTHSQVLDDGVALLVDPVPVAFSKGILQLVNDSGLRARLGAAGQELIEERHTFAVFQADLNALYDRLSGRPSGTVVA